MSFDRYGRDVLSQPAQGHRSTRQAPAVRAERGLVVEDAATGFVGAVVRTEKSGGMHVVVLEDRSGRLRAFPVGAGFMIDGAAITLVAPTARSHTKAPPQLRSASGSTYVASAPARVARGSRIWVEGKHDAELVEKVWGHDLRIEGVVVEMLHGADDLDERVQAFAPGPGRKLGILLDHIVPGSKEWRIAERVSARADVGPHILVRGHPYVDVWQAIKPARVGLAQWPHIERGTDIKIGSLRALGMPANSQEDIAMGWQKILARVRSYADIEPALSGRIEELIDFVTAEESNETPTPRA